MRSSAPLVMLVLAGCATTPTGTGVIRPACEPTSNCFFERQVRDFQVLDDETLLVMVGRDRCAYLVKVDGFFCNLRMTPYVAFRDNDGRICSNDRSFILAGPFLRQDDVCRIYDVSALTDDELLETYAAYGRVQPLPPVGSGELEVEPDAEHSPAEEPASEPGDTQPVVERSAGQPVTGH